MGNGYALHASESTWGVPPVSGWRALEVNVDGHKTAIGSTLTHKGLRAARGAPSSTGRRLTKISGTGSIELPGSSNGLGILLRAAASTAASALHSGGTLAYDQVYEWTSGPPSGRSISTEIYRDRRDGTFDAYTYPGGRVTSMEVGQTLDDFLQFKFAMNYRQPIRHATSPTRTPVTVDPDLLYAWPDATVTLTPVGGSGTAECIESFSLVLPNELDVDDWCLRSGVSEVQTITGSGTWSGGTFTLTVLGATTAAIAYGANAATIGAALVAAGVPSGFVAVSGGPVGTTPLVLTYDASLGNVAAATIDTTSVTGSTPAASVATTTAGVSGERHEPMRAGTPAPTGALAWRYQDPRYYDAFVAGQEFSLSAVWEGDEVIEGTTKPSLRIEVPSLFFSGDDPEISVDGPTKQALPFEVCDNGTDPVATITLVTSDSTF